MRDKQIGQFFDPETLPFHFCPGCGHGVILKHINSALEELGKDPRNVVIVSDIGCSGLSDKYFTTNAFHGLHGRSVTYATGLKLANPDLNVIVLMGDGGCGIGGHHLISAARRNIGVTVLVFNNLNFGMTGGQHSVTTPEGAITSSTKNGNLEYPMDICATVSANGASFVARSTTYNKTLSKLIVEAIMNRGFSLVDIWELCTAYYVPNNKYSKQKLEDTLSSLNFPQGVLRKKERSEFSLAIRQTASEIKGQIPFVGKPLGSVYRATLSEKLRCIIAGDAGMRIGTAASAFSRGAMLSGLWATQRSDYPVTVRSGYSISEVILSPEEVLFTGISNPDLMIILFSAGLEKVRPQISTLTEEDLVLINIELLPVETRANIVPLDFRKSGVKTEYWSFLAIAELLKYQELYPLSAFKAAINVDTPFAERVIQAIEDTGYIADE
jgi:2-oxoglutarate ferredoxin oxidoreductase subunit beta